MSWKLGSLFDGSGGFPLAGSLCDIEPRWASEVEPYPIAVTRSRFPNMIHLGDISKVNGAEVEPVDVITFGSPCQDLSVAGKRAGLKHEANGDEETTRSGLFMEAVRIIKEMREATNGVYPRFALWENVPGAFSSNKGEDFRIVLEELIKIVEPTAAMPEVPKKGWAYADSHIGNGWSIAYRVFDAQYWGVPQRRRRIHLVADFRGTSAREVLFEREGVRGYFTQGGTPWESLAAYAEGGAGADHRKRECTENPALTVYGIDHAITTGGNCTAQGSCVYEDVQATLKAAGPHSVAYTLKIRSGCEGGGKGPLVQTNMSATLATNNDQYLFQPISYGVVSKGNGEAWCIKEKHMALSTGGGQAGQGFPCAMQPIAVATQQGGAEISENGVCPTVTASAGMSGNNQPWICHAVDHNILDDQGGQQINIRSDGKAPTFRAEMHGNIPCVMEAAGFKELNSANARSIGYGEEVSPTISAEKHDACVCVKSWDARGNGDGDTVSTITGDHENRITDYTSLICNPVFCLQGNTVDRDAKQNGSGMSEDVTHTLNSVDRHAVAYAMQGFGDYKESDVASGMKARDYKDATDLVTETQHVIFDKEVYNSGENATGGHYISENGPSPTLRGTGHPPGVAVRYIVRRLTPTECARLQGFADCWGHIEEKDDFTEKEYRFWLDVRNTHAEINGKAVKDYTKKQMLTWYNKLHTDSAEYKMWGNGIALPPALYCMQGITDVLRKN